MKAVNYLLPHIQRVPSRIVRDELAQEIAQKLGIDSAVLRQELRHVASERSAATVKAPAEAQVTDAERILIRALGFSPADAAGRAPLRARRRAKKNSIPRARRNTPCRAKACIAASPPNRWSRPCSMPGPKLPM